MKLIVNENSASSFAVIYFYDNIKSIVKNLSYEKGDQLLLEIDNSTKIQSLQSILRYLAIQANQFYSNNLNQITEIDSWLDIASNLFNNTELYDYFVRHIDNSIKLNNFLVDNRLTVADFAIFAALKSSSKFNVKNLNGLTNLQRYFNSLSSNSSFQAGLPSVKTEAKDYSKEGKFIDLPGAEKGKVVVRFPPEASGYLHVGHAKAALLNQFYKNEFEGRMIFRFDDTNPAKENSAFEEAILHDVKLLGCNYDVFSRTSDHFDILLVLCEKMIKLGKAYADDTDADQMKKEREQQIESKNRNNTVEKNLQMWQEMIKGTEFGQKCCIRAKIDMKSNNGTMRDPTLYRCKPEHHTATGDKYKVYPTYDFACPVVDSIEGVTHALRTTEYHDRDEQYEWILEALALRKPHIYEYSRFNLQNTVLSKRKLTWFVDSGKVSGWDDPRFPTVRGILRHGMTVEALKQFIIAQGSSRSVVQMEWDKIWTINKSFIDVKAPRHNAVLKGHTVVVNVIDAIEESKVTPKHPKNNDVGTKTVWYGPRLLIDHADAETIKEGELVTFMDWGNLQILKIQKNGNKIVSIDAKLCLDNKDFKKTVKLTWLAETAKAPFTHAICIHYDHIIGKAVLEKEEDFKQYCDHKTEFKFDVLGDHEMAKLVKGDIIQIQRRGYYIVDKEYAPASGKNASQPAVLIYIPDGSKKEPPTTYMSITNQIYHTYVVSLADSIKKIGELLKSLEGKNDKKVKEEIEKKLKEQNELKQEYKRVTGNDWKDDLSNNTSTTEQPKAPSSTAATPASSGDSLSNEIKRVGDIIRNLKANKASKEEIDKNVKQLKDLKDEYKKITGNEWKPEAATPATTTAAKPAAQVEQPKAAPVTVTSSASSSNDVVKVFNDIKRVGDQIRDLKAKKAAKDQIDQEVKTLLKLKEDFKKLSGQDWKPDLDIVKMSNTSEKLADLSLNNNTTSASGDANNADTVSKRIKEVGDSVRNLKSNKAPKDQIDKEVKVLLELKNEYKKLTGKDWTPDGAGASTAAVASSAKATPTKAEKPAKQAEVDDSSAKKVTKLSIDAKKKENLPDWYSQLITKSELIEYYDVSGCYILRPWSYFIWEQIKNKFDANIRKLGVQNCYFPLFVSKAALEREKTHIDDFAPEVAWVTKSGLTDLAEHIAIRPTSETVMYPAYGKWIQSYRDLPLKLNQWNNVVRWEFKHPQPFLRTREFLWQEGHTAFSNQEEAAEEVYKILDLYADVYKSLLAVPVIKGRKTEKEKFAGADWTTTIEAYISASGRGIQAATSHHLGQNFSKMFDIAFEDPETQAKKYVYQNSWGLTTRTIGILAMIHGDDTGLVLPPAVACYQVVIVPCGITASLSKDDEKKLIEKCKWYEKVLIEADVRVHGDYRDNYSPGWKFNHWELKGVPVRLEVGPRDIAQQKFVAVRRDTGVKTILEEKNAVELIKKLLDDIHENLYTTAEKDLKAHLAIEDTWDGFLKQLDAKKIIMSPFCGGKQCEEKIKKDSARDAVVEEGAPAMGAKSLCIPLEQPKEITNQKCFHPQCGQKAQYYTLFGRSY